MAYRVETNDTRSPATVWYDDLQSANRMCAAKNLDAYHAGAGGLYGVYRSDGSRVAWDDTE